MAGFVGRRLRSFPKIRAAGTASAHFAIESQETLVMICFVAAFRRGGSPTVLYPVYATTFIWAALIGIAVYQVPIKAVHVLGMALIIAGISLLGW